METGIDTNFEQIGEDYQYTVKFSDNPFTMVFTGTMEACNKIASTLDDRIDRFYGKQSNELKTSDLGFEYIKL